MGREKGSTGREKKGVCVKCPNYFCLRLQFTLELQGQIQAIYILRKVYYGSTSPVSPTFGALTCAQHKKSSHTRGTMMTLKFTLRKHLVFA